MKSVALEAFPREKRKRNAVKALRGAGRIPAVLYGRGHESRSVELDTKTFETLVNDASSSALLVDLACDGETNLALVKEVQHHPLSGQYLHVDFQAVKVGEPVTVFISVEAVGEAEGVKVGGGLLEHVLFRIRVRGLPEVIPDIIEVDVSHLEIGHTLHVKDLQVPEGVEVLANDDNPVFSVAKPRTVVEETTAEGEEGEEGVEGEEGAAEGAEGEAKSEGSGEDKKEGE